MRIFNLDGSEGKMAGNSIRCVGKYLYDNGFVKKDKITVETASGVKVLKLFTRDGKVSSAKVSMGKAELNPAKIPVSVIAAVENGYCSKDEDITVKVKGGDLIVNYSDNGVTLTGDCNLVYKGEIEY